MASRKIPDLGGARIVEAKLVRVHLLYHSRHENTEFLDFKMSNKVLWPVDVPQPTDDAAKALAERMRKPGFGTVIEDTVALALYCDKGLALIYQFGSSAPFKTMWAKLKGVADRTMYMPVRACASQDDDYDGAYFMLKDAPPFEPFNERMPLYRRTGKATGRTNGIAWTLNPRQLNPHLGFNVASAINKALNIEEAPSEGMVATAEPDGAVVAVTVVRAEANPTVKQAVGALPPRPEPPAVPELPEPPELPDAPELPTPPDVPSPPDLPTPPPPVQGSVVAEQVVQARTGQGLYRRNLERVEGRCRITGLANKTHLRASHIKPWAVCTDPEKLDGNNGLLLSPHIDHLFDQGYISFHDNGDLMVSKALDPAVLDIWNIAPGINVGRFNATQRHYLSFHRAHIFKG